MKAIALALALSAPLAGYDVSSGFGYRDSLGGLTEYHLHDGLDYAAPIGTPVHAAASGYVRETWPYKTGHAVYGHMVIIKHRPGLMTLYGHLSKIWVAEGEFVLRGQVIGLTGDTGLSTGPHLHFQVMIDPQLAIIDAPQTGLTHWISYWSTYKRQTELNIPR